MDCLSLVHMSGNGPEPKQALTVGMSAFEGEPEASGDEPGEI